MITRRGFVAAFASRPGLRIAPFETDVTPPLGAPLCIALVPPGERVEDPLLARGMVLYPARQKPIVLCAIDWLGIGNTGYDRWREVLAKAVDTTPDRVAVHTVHQHDAPGDDASANELLEARGLANVIQQETFTRDALGRVAAAAKMARPQRVTHLSAGAAEVEGVASNRRILDAQGKFLFQRFTACRANPLCDAPVGVIDPRVKSVGFWDGERRIATLAYYATHPMSHYGKGAISADFVGAARAQQDGFTVYFTGAAGNIGAGKYNNGAPANRVVLASRLGDGLKRARAAERKFAVERIDWRVERVALPLRAGAEFTEEAILRMLDNRQLIPRDRSNAARYLAWHRLVKQGRRIDLTALECGPLTLLHMPGELFVEYQLAAQREAPGQTVALAAYGDYGPMYIGTRQAYTEGGYETGPVSRVAPEVEDMLLNALRRLAGKRPR